jgi:peptide/nickel transport system substrate-binding protein
MAIGMAITGAIAAKAKTQTANCCRARLGWPLRRGFVSCKPMTRLLIICLFSSLACGDTAMRQDATVLSVLLAEAPESLDPRRGSSAVEMRVQELLFRGLVRVADNLDVTEDLAASIIFDGAQHLTIYLKPQIAFHPCFDGTPGGFLKAADVAYTYESLSDPAVRSGKQRILADIARIDYPDPGGLEVHFHLRRPLANWLGEHGTLGIVEAACARKDPKKFARHPSGTGAVAFLRRDADRRLLLRTFAPDLGFSQLELRFISDETSRLLELLKGRADVLTVTPSRPLLAALARRKQLELISAPGNGYSYLAFNLRLPALADLRVRRALAWAIDRAAIITHKYLGLARPSAAMTPPEHWAHPRGLKPTPFAPRRAAESLAAAGYRANPELLADPSANDQRPILRLEMRTTPEKFGRALSLVLQKQLRHIGVDLALRINDWGTLYSQVKKGNFQLVRMEWIPVLSPALLDWVFHSKSRPGVAGACYHVRDCPGAWEEGAEATAERYSCSAQHCAKATPCAPGCAPAGGRCAATEAGVCARNGGNRGGYENAEVDRLLDRAALRSDQVEQARLYARVQRILAADLPYISLWHEDRVWVLRKPWSGIALKPSGSLLGLLSARLAK